MIPLAQELPFHSLLVLRVWSMLVLPIAVGLCDFWVLIPNLVLSLGHTVSEEPLRALVSYPVEEIIAQPMDYLKGFW